MHKYEPNATKTKYLVNKIDQMQLHLFFLQIQRKKKGKLHISLQKQLFC